jgi:hypothetical protein
MAMSALRDIERRAPGTRGFFDYDAFITNELAPALLVARKFERQIQSMRRIVEREESAASASGLAVGQEPKYTVRDGHIANRASGDTIPDEEPVFIFRARDRHAAAVLEFYAKMVHDTAHFEAVCGRLDDFRRFSKEHPERMKEPDTESRSEGAAKNG